MENHELKARAARIVPTIRIGKAGISDSAIEEIIRQLKAKKIIKVKMLRNFSQGKDKDDAIRGILDATGAKLVEKKGSVFALYRR